jgi:hypothetical protein
MNQMTIISVRKLVLCGVILFFSVAPGMGVDAKAEASHFENAESERIDGTYVISLPMPGGAKESTLVLSSQGNSLMGTMSEPGNPSQVSPIRNASCVDGRFKLSADIGRIAFNLEGVCSEGKLKFDMTTMETIPLGEGTRLQGKTGEIAGKYLVPVYSPGGIKENHFDLAAKNGVITGEMYVLDDGGGLSEERGGPPANMPPPQERGPSAGAGEPPPGSGMNVASDGKRDLNIFFDGTYQGNNISLYVKTAQGSLFHFTGMVEGDRLKLTMHVTDLRSGIEGKRVK